MIIGASHAFPPDSRYSEWYSGLLCLFPGQTRILPTRKAMLFPPIPGILSGILGFYASFRVKHASFLLEKQCFSPRFQVF
jgi:hypothetical protein